MVEQAITPLPPAPLRAAMAAPPVSREQYFADMTALKEQISTVKGAGNVEEAIKTGNWIRVARSSHKKN